MRCPVGPDVDPVLGGFIEVDEYSITENAKQLRAAEREDDVINGGACRDSPVQPVASHGTYCDKNGSGERFSVRT